MDVLSMLLRDLASFFYIVPITTNYHSLKDVPDYIQTALPYFVLLIVIELLYVDDMGINCTL